MRAGQNVWIKLDVWGKVAESVYQEEDPGEEFVPLYAKRRVRGASYTPYQGSSDWVRAANAAMNSKANDNYRRG